MSIDGSRKFVCGLPGFPIINFASSVGCPSPRLGLSVAPVVEVGRSAVKTLGAVELVGENFGVEKFRVTGGRSRRSHGARLAATRRSAAGERALREGRDRSFF